MSRSVEEMEETYIELADEQTRLIEEFRKNKADFNKSNVSRRQTKVAEWFSNLEDSFETFKQNNLKLIELNVGNVLNQRSYFKANLYTKGCGVHEEFKALLSALMNQTAEGNPENPEATGSNDRSPVVEEEVNPSTEIKVQKLEQKLNEVLQQQQASTEQLNKLIGLLNIANLTNNKSDEIPLPAKAVEMPVKETEGSFIEKLTDVMYMKKNEKDYPEFPKDVANYMTFRHEVDNWETTDGKTVSKKNMLQKLKDSVAAKNEKAYNLFGFMELLDGNYATALELLDERYLNIKNVMFAQIEKLIKMAQAKDNNATSLQEIHDTVVPALSNMRSLIKHYVIKDVAASDDDPRINKLILDAIMSALMYRKLDSATLTALAGRIKDKETPIPQPEKVLEIIKQRFSNLTRQGSSTEATSNSGAKAQKVRVSAVSEQAKKKHCLFCNKDGHETKVCRQFTQRKMSERFPLVKEHKVCANCLNAIYKKCDCIKKGKSNCSKCNSMHHTLLHDDDYIPKARQVPVAAIAQISAESTRGEDFIAIRPTARVRISTFKGIVVIARAFIDTGATNSMITKKLAEKLGFKIDEKAKPVARTRDYCNRPGDPILLKLDVRVRPYFKSDFKIEINVCVTATLAGKMPVREVDCHLRPERLDLLTLADPGWSDPADVDMIIGVADFTHLMGNKTITLDDGFMMIETKFGYICMGEAFASISAIKIHDVEMEPEDPLKGIKNMEAFNRFFDHHVEEQEKEDFAEQFFKATIQRDKDGFIVRIPFKPESELGDSKKITVARIRNMLRRLPDHVRKQYIQQCQSLVQQGFMKKADSKRPARNYVANFALATKSLTTPVRLLFTCDQRTTNGRSVNDIQYAGPKLQQDLTGCVFKFRLYKYGVTGDISKMFLRLRVHPDDATYQHTFIGETADGPLKEMVLPTVIFGMKSSPFLAIRCMLELASQEEKEFPIASQLVRNNFYVDDFLGSFASIEEAKQAVRELRKMLPKGNFELRKWAASDDECLTEVPQAERLDSVALNIDEEKTQEEIKILGVRYNKILDVINYKVNVEKDTKITKRTALSTIARIYDPIGILAPNMVVAKLLIQEMWRLDGSGGNKAADKKGWDAELPETITLPFANWKAELKLLEKIEIPRWLNHKPENDNMLLGFSDASGDAYASVLYMRSVDEHGKVNLALIGSRVKVTPLKKKFVPTGRQDELTIPRLELMAAVLLTEQIESLTKAVAELRGIQIKCFTDSQIALAWIQGDESRWQTFVANRTRKIVKIVPAKEWSYVNTKENPADLPSRGISAKELICSSLWMNGPEFAKASVLVYHQNSWETKLEEKSQISLAAVDKSPPSEWIDICDNISTWTKLVRIMAYVLRMKDVLNNVRQGVKSQWETQLKIKEIVAAETWIIKVFQQHAYPYEIRSVESNQNITKGKLQHYAPFFDKEKLLRGHGRFDAHPYMSYNEKNPIILPSLEIPEEHGMEDERKAPLTRKIIQWAHLSTMHGGELRTMTFLKQKYHIPNMRGAIRYVLHRCLTCAINKPKMYCQLMGNLPRDSLLPAPPFFHTTLDYAGPINIQYDTRKRRRQTDADEVLHIIKSKAWISVFVCRLTGAYHIELVHELTAIACVNAFKRFVATRGLPKTVRSDNATTFIKTKKIFDKNERKAHELSIIAINAGNKEVQEHFAFKQVEILSGSKEMEWEMNPPLAPDFGGKHEAAVKQVKTTLKKTIGNATLPFITLSTILKQVEAMLNSRPLCRAQGTVYDRDQILTPAHYLIGRPLTTLPEADYTTSTNLTDRYVIQQRMTQEFWKAWKTLYLSQLQQRPKWTTIQPNAQVGEIVLLKEENTPPLTWPKARIVEAIPGKDNLVRVVVVEEASKKQKKRSIRQIVRLPIVFGGENAKAQRNNPVWPLIAPSTTAAPANVAAPDPPLRRSTRIKAKKCSKISVAMMMITLICVMFTPCMARNSQQDSMRQVDDDVVKTVNTSGLFFLQEKEVYLKLGVHHVEVKTNLNAENDRQRVNRFTNAFKNICQDAMKRFTWLICQQQSHHIEVMANTTLSTINSVDKPSKLARTKRNSKPGLIVRMLRYLFLSSDDDDDASQAKTMGVVRHAAEAFQHVEQQLLKKSQHVEKGLVHLADEINHQKKKSATDANLIDARIHFIEMTAMILETYKQINERYITLHETPDISDEELRTVIDTINKNVTDGVIPPIKLMDLRKLMKTSVKMEKGNVTIFVELPVVYKDLYEQYFVVPMPQADSSKVPDVNPQTIIINQRLQQYVMTQKLQDINEKIAITEDTIQIVEKVSQHTNCVIATIMREAGSCKMRPMPETYDEWLTTPLHNVIVFYSTETKELVCKNSRSIIKEQTGLIKLKKDCYVETKSHIIRASPDKVSQARHVFKIDVDEKLKLDKKMVQEKLFTYDLDATKIDENKVEDVLKEAVDTSQAFSFLESTAILIAVTVSSILATVIVGFICYWKIFRNRPSEYTTESLEMTQVGTTDPLTEDTLSMKKLQEEP